MNAGHEYVGGTRSSGIMSSAANVLEMSVVRGMRGVGGMCEISLAWVGDGEEWGEWMRGFHLGFTNPVGTGDVGRVSMFGFRWCEGCRWGVCRGLGTGSRRMG